MDVTFFSTFAMGQGVTALMLTWLSGATLCPFDIRRDGVARLTHWMSERRLTVWMSSATLLRSLMRTLTDDDTSAICSTYPPNATRVTAAGPVAATACDPTPRHGLQTAPNQTPVRVSNGCASTPGGAGEQTFPALATGLTVLALTGVRRRRRRAAASLGR